MHRRLRLFWGLLLLLSVAWIAAGSFITSQYFDKGSLGGDVTAEIRSFSSDLEIDGLAALPLPVVFLATGLPFAAIALFFLWRNQRMITSSAAKATSSGEPNVRRQTVGIAIVALIFALLLWNVPGVNTNSPSLSAVVYPVRLFVTFVHEAGHSLAALITGGQVQAFTVFPDGSGLAKTAGGNPALILPAGYLGAALFGALLFFLTNCIPKWTRSLSFLIGLSIIILTLSFAMPHQAGNSTALIIGIGFGVGMMAMGWQAPQIINVFILNTLAILTGLNAVFDLWLLVGNADAGRGDVLNDAAAFSREITPLLPASVVALIWAVVAVAMLACAFYFGLVKQVQGEIHEAVNGKSKGMTNDPPTMPQQYPGASQ